MKNNYKKRPPKEILLRALRLIYFITVVALVYLIYSFDKQLPNSDKILVYWGALAGLVAIYKIKFFKRAPWRLVFTMLASFLTLKYLYWRTFETLIYTGFFDFVGMTALYIAELHGIIIHLLGMFISIWPMDRKLVVLADTEMNDSLPTVDILIPTYSEPEEIVKITATAAKQVDYPKDRLRIFILDDGGTIGRRNSEETSDESWERHYSLRKLANEIGVGYITRETNKKAKAGNINNALNHTDGELILVLDCDHVPTRDILTKTVGYFLRDEKLYLVQTPHFFINPTPIEKNLETVSNVSVENDMFFRIIHSGLDFWNASYFCGSAALLRRKHLEEIDGIEGKTITEDAETSLTLHSKGYNSIYVNYPMVCGLSPETFDDYVTQRTRWAQGMIQLFLLRNAFSLKGLNLPQKLCYFNSCFFWFFSISRFVFYIAPSLFLLFGLRVYNASLGDVIIYAVPYVFSTTFVMDFFFGGARQPFFSEMYESVQSLFLAPAIISVLINPEKPMFKVTAKGTSIEKETLNPLASAFLIVVFINLLAIVFGVFKWFDNVLLRDVIVLTAVWCTYNLAMAFISLGAFWEKKQIRRYHRIKASGPVRVHIPSTNETVTGEIKDISLAGLSFECKLIQKPASAGKAELHIVDEYGEEFNFAGIFQRVQLKKDVYYCGVKFDDFEENFAKYVRYVYGSSSRWVDIWEKKSSFEGTSKLLKHLLLLGMKGFVEILGSYFSQVKDIALKYLRKNSRLRSIKIFKATNVDP